MTAEVVTKKTVQRILLLVTVFAVYGVSLVNGFVWDDNIYFIGNSVYRDFNLRAIFGSLANGVEYLPLRDLTYAFDYLLWGESPAGFHLTNILLFSANVLLVHTLAAKVITRLAARSGREYGFFVPFMVAALYAIHPLNAEVVNFITCRNVLVSGCFFYGACLVYFNRLQEDRINYALYALALLFFAGAMLGKATAITLPVTLVATGLILFPERRRRALVLSAPFFAVAGCFYIGFRQIAEKAGLIGLSTVGVTASNVWTKSAVALQIPFFYLKKLLLPYGFSVEYSADFSTSLLSWQPLLALLLLVAAGILLWHRRKSHPELLFGAVWFVTALIPVLNFLSNHPVVADRYCYLPLFGLIFAAGAGLDLVAGRVARIAMVAVAVLLALVSVNRSLEWRDDERLWSANIRNFPKDTKSYMNLAGYYFNRDQMQRGIDLLKANPDVPWVPVYLDYFEGVQLFSKHELSAAKMKFQKPADVLNHAGSYYYLGKIAEEEGDLVKAAYNYNKALTSSEKAGVTETSLARERLALLKSDWLDKQLLSLRQGLQRDPANNLIRRDLALLLDNLGFYKDAAAEYAAIEKSGVKGWQIYHNLGNCYYNINDYQKAVVFYEKALALGGGTEDTYNNLGVAYKKLEQYGKSAAVLQQAQQSYPAAPYPLFNLGLTYYAAGKFSDARAAFEAVGSKFPDFKDRATPFIKELSSK